jgi:hypothetical protein
LKRFLSSKEPKKHPSKRRNIPFSVEWTEIEASFITLITDEICQLIQEEFMLLDTKRNFQCRAVVDLSATKS